MKVSGVGCQVSEFSTFDAIYGISLVSFSIKLVAFLANGRTDTRHLKPIKRAANLLTAKLKY